MSNHSTMLFEMLMVGPLFSELGIVRHSNFMMPPTTRSSIPAASVFGSNYRNVHIIIFISTVKITLLSIDMLSWSSISSSFFSLGSFLLERKIMFNMTEQISEEMRVGIPTQLIKHLQKINVLLMCEKP